MTKVLRVFRWVFGSLLVIVIAGFTWVQTTYRRDFSGVETPNIHASQDPAVIARGEYLANAVSHCPACHQPGYYVQKRTLTSNLADLRGGNVFHAGPFGTFRAANLTSDAETGVGNLSDGELARAIRHGVDRRGGFAPFMALSVGHFSDEDLTALVSYLRTLPPKKNAVPVDEWGLVAKVLAHGFEPHDEPPIKHVAEGGVSVERGQYLANGPAGCYTCHSQRDPLHGFAYTGARFTGNPDAEPDEFDSKYEIVVPNLTPDPETGRSGQMNEDQFVARIRAGRTVVGSHMPWENFQRMTDDDLRSIYRYLRSLPPVKHDVGPSYRPAGWTPS